MTDVPFLCEFTVGFEYNEHDELRLRNFIIDTSLIA